MPKTIGDTNSTKLIFKILETLAESPGSVGVTELALILGATKTRVFRLLQVLLDIGYVVQSGERERYQIGSRLITLGYSVAKNIDLLGASMQPMRDLRDKLGHTVVIGQVEADGVRIMMSVTGSAPMQISVRQGWLLPFHSSAQGKVALAYLDSDRVRTTLSGQLDPLTEKTFTDADKLGQQLETVRAQGWATAPSESVIGLNVLAFPILDESSSIAGTLGIVDFEQFIGARPTPEQLSAVHDTAQLISTRLGYAGGDGRKSAK